MTQLALDVVHNLPTGQHFGYFPRCTNWCTRRNIPYQTTFLSLFIEQRDCPSRMHIVCIHDWHSRIVYRIESSPSTFKRHAVSSSRRHKELCIRGTSNNTGLVHHSFQLVLVTFSFRSSKESNKPSHASSLPAPEQLPDISSRRRERRSLDKFTRATRETATPTVRPLADSYGVSGCNGQWHLDILDGCHKGTYVACSWSRNTYCLLDSGPCPTFVVTTSFCLGSSKGGHVKRQNTGYTIGQCQPCTSHETKIKWYVRLYGNKPFCHDCTFL